MAFTSSRRSRFPEYAAAALAAVFAACPYPADAEPVFKDVTVEVGLTGVGGNTCAWGDYDGDGWVDLYDGGTVWRNLRGKKFTKIEELGLAGGKGMWVDFDNDGRLDLYSLAHKLYRNIGGDRFKDVSAILGERPLNDCRGAAWGDFDNDGFLDLYMGGYEGGGYQLDAVIRNDKGKAFSKWWQIPTKTPARGVTAADFDVDGDLDIYVSNYRLVKNYLWRNDGKGNFTDVGEALGVDGDGGLGAWGHTIGSSWGDLDNDGWLDLFVGNFSHAAAYQDRPEFLRNTGRKGKFVFEDKSGGAGLARQESFASPTLGDYDNDGDLDIYFTTVYGGNNAVLYRNEGDWKFKNVTAEEGLGGMPPTYQAAWADVDNDGDLDLATGGRLYLNRGSTGNHWLKIRLQGAGKVNRSAIGAQVRIKLGDAILTRQVESSTGEGNQNDMILHFGLGMHKGPVKIHIRWPNGRVQKVTTGVDKAVKVTMPMWLDLRGPGTGRG